MSELGHCDDPHHDCVEAIVGGSVFAAIKIDLGGVQTIILDDENCHIGAVIRVVLGGMDARFVARGRDASGVLQWERIQ